MKCYAQVRTLLEGIIRISVDFNCEMREKNQPQGREEEKSGVE